jgi:hypothetical protein
LRDLPIVDTLVISETARVEAAGTLVKSSSVYVGFSSCSALNVAYPTLSPFSCFRFVGLTRSFRDYPAAVLPAFIFST